MTATIAQVQIRDRGTQTVDGMPDEPFRQVATVCVALFEEVFQVAAVVVGENQRLRAPRVLVVHPWLQLLAIDPQLTSGPGIVVYLLPVARARGELAEMHILRVASRIVSRAARTCSRSGWRGFHCTRGRA